MHVHEFAYIFVFGELRQDGGFAEVQWKGGTSMNRIQARQKAAALVAQMTAEEKVSQMLYTSPAIERLGIASHNWWNEALHGVARAGLATVFPQAISLAATFDPVLVQQVGDTIAKEARAKYNAAQALGDHGQYKGLTFWSPNINIFRDPRWGRGHETYGEDPYLTSAIGVGFVRGLQGEGEFLKAAACAKHYAVHSGPEEGRHSFNAEVGQQDLWETYLPAFEWLVKEGQVESIMGAYNRVNGEPCCGSPTLLKDILREKWGFEGHVVSDCGAIQDFHNGHAVTATGVESAAMALKNGCDLNCGTMYGYLMQALDKGLITDEMLTESVTRLFTTRVLLGEFEEERPYADLGMEWVDHPDHQKQNLEVAKRSIVLLKNNGILPIAPESVGSIAVIGPVADRVAVLEGNYNGTAGEYVTLAEGIRRAYPNARVYVSAGCHLYQDTIEGEQDDRLTEAETLAKLCDVTVLCVGLDRCLEGEEGDLNNIYGGGDKAGVTLPACQQRLVDRVCGVSDRVVVITTSGSAIDAGPAAEHAAAQLQVFYPGARGGEALGQILRGDDSPSGRLPVTFYRKDATLPAFEDYRMTGRTYRFYKGEPLYPFGFGLSYTTFEYRDLQLPESIQMGEELPVEVTVINTGDRTGLETVQVYIHQDLEGLRTPLYQLCGVESIMLAPGESKRVRLSLSPYWLSVVTEKGERKQFRGKISVYAGGHQPDRRSEELCGYRSLVEQVLLME